MSARDRNTEAGSLRFLDFKPISLSTTCTKISEVLCRSEDEGICPDDLDALRTELQYLQDVLQTRVQDINEEMDALSDMQEKVTTQPAPTLEKKKSSSAGSVSSNHKRREPDSGHRLSVDAKRVKTSSSDPVSTASSPAPAASSSQPRKSAGAESSNDKKNKVKTKQSKSDQLEAELQLAKVKQDTSNKFWAAVEQYCAPITEQDVKALRQLAQAPEDDQELYKIPTLGRHYSYQWSQEDVGDEEKPGCRSRDKTKSLTSSAASTHTASTHTASTHTASSTGSCTAASGEGLPMAGEGLVPPAEESTRHETCSLPLGPLTQRLVSALLEDKSLSGQDVVSGEVQSPTDSSSTVGDCSPGGDRQPVAASHQHHSMASSSASDKKDGQASSQRNWVVSNAKLLEARIHEQLVHLGLMEVDEVVPAEDEEDEVLAELRKRQSELKAVSEYNRQLKLALLQRAEMEMEKQALQEKVRKADSEVLDCLKKVTASKQRKKVLTKKERDQAYQALSQRTALVKRREQLRQAAENLFSSSLP